MSTYVKSHVINFNFILVIICDNKICPYRIKISHLKLFVKILSYKKKFSHYPKILKKIIWGRASLCKNMLNWYLLQDQEAMTSTRFNLNIHNM